MSKKETKKPSDFKFEADGKVYAFHYPTVTVQNKKGGYERLTAEQCMETPEVLAQLLISGSEAIKLVEDKPQEKPVSKLNKAELIEKLTELEVEFDSSATVAELKKVLVDHLNTEENAE